MKAVLFLALLGVAFASASLFSEHEYQFLFSKWIAQHHKKYNHENFFYRYTVFKRNMDHIVSTNKRKLSYTLGMNAFGDLTPEEFKATYASGYRSIHDTVHRKANSPRVSHHRAPLVDSVDWRDKGAVTDVKNQGQCGSCWAFSATGSMESAVFIASGKLIPLSEQQLVDCSQAEGNQGCNGGLMDQAFQYVVSNNGLTSEANYAYTAMDGTCKAPLPKSVATITGYQDVTPSTSGKEGDLQAAIVLAPVSVAIEADQQVFQFYSGGVIEDASCGTNLDHGVLAVGYKLKPSDQDTAYYIVKNSWGAGWGLSGYVYIQANQNMCGIGQEPSYPTGASAL